MSHGPTIHWTYYRVRPHAELRWLQRALPNLTDPVELSQAVSQSRFWGRWGHLYIRVWHNYAFLFAWQEPWPETKPAPAVLTSVWPLEWVERKALHSPEGA
ncbi:hypothetical protein [Sulfobacillus harzensis]|uniref:Uncharacterized protein n=1 Tax=Sulfobacillus harzensis TaxID=2729629 RepID=A0A7Y0Q470_9FIRM|nr:hypothetical protein [Sulfobacillus harzensis]NMP22924.1 hypothetical protein [Sulfobacillus harzensis]